MYISLYTVHNHIVCIYIVFAFFFLLYFSMFLFLLHRKGFYFWFLAKLLQLFAICNANFSMRSSIVFIRQQRKNNLQTPQYKQTHTIYCYIVNIYFYIRINVSLLSLDIDNKKKFLIIVTIKPKTITCSLMFSTLSKFYTFSMRNFHLDIEL